MTAPSLNAAQQRALNEALNMAMGAGDLDMMKNAVDSGADANIMLFGGIRNSKLDWVKAAVDHGADVHATMRSSEDNGIMEFGKSYPAFFWVASHFDPNVADYLLSQKVAIDALSADGDSALMAAVRVRDQAVIKYLVAHDADPLLMCGVQAFPLKYVEEDNRWFNSSDKLAVVKEMMSNTKRRRDKTMTATPANDSAAAATSDAIEISRPIELKRKPQAGFTL